MPPRIFKSKCGERDVPRDGHQGQVVLPAGPDHGCRNGLEVGFQAKAEGADAGPDQAPHIGVHRLLPAAVADERQTGREQEFAVEQVGGRIVQLAGLHPAQALVPVAAVVQDGERRQLAQELCQGDETEPLGVLRGHGRVAVPACAATRPTSGLSGALSLMAEDYRSFCTTVRGGSQA